MSGENSLARKSSPCWERDSRVRDQLPQGLTSMSLHPEAGGAKLYKDGTKKKSRAASICQAARATVTPSDLLCKGAQQLLPQKKAMLCKLPQTPSRFYWVFTPQVFAIHLSPLHSLACCTPTGTQDPLGQASTAVGDRKSVV